jgi:hypothetical protein
MSLSVAVAEQILRARFGEPAKPPTQYVVGFKTTVGRVLVLHREAGETRMWFPADRLAGAASDLYRAGIHMRDTGARIRLAAATGHR